MGWWCVLLLSFVRSMQFDWMVKLNDTQHKLNLGAFSSYIGESETEKCVDSAVFFLNQKIDEKKNEIKRKQNELCRVCTCVMVKNRNVFVMYKENGLDELHCVLLRCIWQTIGSLSLVWGFTLFHSLIFFQLRCIVCYTGFDYISLLILCMGI